MGNLRDWESLRGKKLTDLVDSWCWIEYFEGTKLGKPVKERIDSNETLFISVINLSEVYKWGLIKKTEKEANEMAHIMLSRCFIIPVEPTTALNAAKTNFEKKWGLGDFNGDGKTDMIMQNITNNYDLNISNEQKPFRRNLHDLKCTFFFIYGCFNKNH